MSTEIKFLIHIITDKVSIPWNKYLGEGRETSLWVSEIAASHIQGAWGDITSRGESPGLCQTTAQTSAWLSKRQPAPAGSLCSKTHI